MDGWTDRGRIDGRTDEQIDGWIDRLMNVLIHVQIEALSLCFIDGL